MLKVSSPTNCHSAKGGFFYAAANPSNENKLTGLGYYKNKFGSNK
jgi:hypothetical protein